MAPPHARETRDLIEHLHIRRLRRKWGRVLFIGVAAAVVLAALITGVVLATAAPGDQASGRTPSSLAGATTSERVATTDSTTTEPVTTETATTGTVTTTAASSPPHTQTIGGPATTSVPPTTSTTNWLASKVVAIDPGHQAHADSALEPIGPGSKVMKAKVSSGTSSVLSGVPESETALAVGLKLRDALTAMGLKVVMTRTTQNVDISNSARARLGNDAHANLTVRLHANGSGDRSVHGLFTLYPASITGWTDDIAAASKVAATIVQRDLVAATGAQDRGLQERSDLTGFNWSDVPVVLVEMGFMSNPAEDTQLRTPAYQDKIVQGLVQAIVEFLRTE